MVTINDVARRAGVSRSTVSLVINHSPLVKDATRQLVERVIAEINYVPNSNARGLSARVTRNLGVVFMQDYLPSTTQISYDNDQHVGLASYNLFNGIMAGLTGTDYGVITERFCSVAEPEGLPRMVREKRVDGVFVVGAPYSDCFIENLRQTGLPLVMAGVNSYETNVDSVSANPCVGTALAMDELISTGHRRICLLNCPSLLHSHELRLQGYRQKLEAAGMDFLPEWNIQMAANNGKCAYAAFKAFWEAGNRPDGMVAANGQSAAGALVYLYEIGVRVPDDLSIIAYEDSSICGYAAPALTSVNIRKEEVGRKAAQCMLSRLREPSRPTEHFSIDPFLVRRASVQPRNAQASMLGGSSFVSGYKAV